MQTFYISSYELEYLGRHLHDKLEDKIFYCTDESDAATEISQPKIHKYDNCLLFHSADKL